MVVLGLSTRFVKPGSKPTVSCVALEGARGASKQIAGYELKTSATDIVAQIEDLCRKLSSELSSLKPDSAVIRVADTAPSASRKNGPRYRLMIEGALAYVCREHKVAKVVYRTGKECGEALSLNKSEALALGQSVDPKRAEAATAALCGLPSTATTSQTH